MHGGLAQIEAGLRSKVAARARAGLVVCGSRKDGAGWLVLVTVRGEDGAFTQVSLTTAEARRHAAELSDMADVLDGVVW